MLAHEGHEFPRRFHGHEYSQTYLFTFSRSLRSIRGTSETSFRLIARAARRLATPRIARCTIRSTSFCLPAFRPHVPVSRVIPGVLEPFDPSFVSEVWASATIFQGLARFTTRVTLRRVCGACPSGFSTDARRDTEPLTLRHRLAIAPGFFALPVSSRASRSISSLSVKMNDFPDPECLLPMRTFSRSSESLSTPEGDATFIASRRRTLSCAPCT